MRLERNNVRISATENEDGSWEVIAGLFEAGKRIDSRTLLEWASVTVPDTAAKNGLCYRMVNRDRSAWEVQS